MNLNMRSVSNAIVTIEMEPIAKPPLEAADISSFFLDALGAVNDAKPQAAPEHAARNTADLDVSGGTELPLTGNLSEFGGNILPPLQQEPSHREPAQVIAPALGDFEKGITPDSGLITAAQTEGQAEPVLNVPARAAPLPVAAPLAEPAETRHMAREQPQSIGPGHPVKSAKLGGTPRSGNAPVAPLVTAEPPGFPTLRALPESILPDPAPLDRLRPKQTLDAKSVTPPQPSAFLPDTSALAATARRDDRAFGGAGIEATPVAASSRNNAPEKDGPAPPLPTSSTHSALTTAPLAAHGPASIAVASPLQSLQPVANTSRPLETLIENLVEARESGRLARGDMILRHAEFGAITLQLENSDKDVRAFVSSRDPGFAPAAQAALADHAKVAVATESTPSSRNAEHSPTAAPHREGSMAQHGDRGGSRQSDPESRQPDRTDHPSRDARSQKSESEPDRHQSAAAQRALYA